MTPAPAEPRSGKTTTGFIVGCTVAAACFLVLGLLGGVVGYSHVKKKEMDVRRGWNLVPVVVAAQDIAENTTVTMEMISQRSIPEQFVTSSVVKPDSASYIVNQKLLVPVQAGDPLLWSQFETTKRPVVLVAAHDIGVGHAMADDDFAEAPFYLELLTPSYVRPEQRPELAGRKTRASFRKGDPILWTHFSVEPPGLEPSPGSGGKGR